MSVLLPAPFWPTSARTSPRPRVKSTPCSTSPPAKLFLMPRIESRGLSVTVSAVTRSTPMLSRSAPGRRVLVDVLDRDDREVEVHVRRLDPVGPTGQVPAGHLDTHGALG